MQVSLNIQNSVNSINTVDNSPSFKQISIVKVPKKAFHNPSNIEQCSLQFGEALDRLTGNQHDFLSDLILGLTGKSRKIKTAHYLEGEDNVKITQLPVLDDIHTFVVLTKKEKDQVTSMFSLKNIIKTIWMLKRQGIEQDIDDYLAERTRSIIINNNNIKQYEINDLDGLMALKSDLKL